MVKRKEKVLHTMLMVIYMKDNGKMMFVMEKELYLLQIRGHMKEILKIMILKEKEL